ncbi:MAG: hypothetical protein HOC74_35530, partial [Gemmatimonadetes bacterium]|nr:hypothetical protein [Gemmatimonadota bacterium]
MIKWLFFDVGNVLVVDELYNATLWTILLESARARNPAVTLQTLMTERERLVLELEDPTPFDTQGRNLLGSTGWEEAKNPVREQLRDSWMDLNVPVPGWATCLESLKGRFHLGIAANQPGTCRHHLQQLQLLEYFEVVGIVQSDSASEGAMQTPDQQTDAYIPLKVAKSRFGDVFSQRKDGTRIRELVQLHKMIVE